jgi:PAS domain S-box-containing protein
LLCVTVSVAANPLYLAIVGDRTPFMVWWPGVVLCGYVGGMRPALVLAAIGVASVLLLHPHSLGARGLSDPGSWLVSVFFIVVSVLTAFLAEAVGQQRRRTATLGDTERALADARTRFAQVASISPDMLFVFDVIARRVVEVSPHVTRITGWSEEEFLGQSDATRWFVHPDDIQLVEMALDRLAGVPDKQVVEVEYRAMHRAGQYHWLRVRSAVYQRTPDGRVRSVMSNAEDITDRKTAESEREQLLEAERTARLEAERASRLKDEFLATLSHELRTPLTAILGWTALLEGNLPAEEVREGVAVISRNAHAQRALIEDLLDMNRILSGKLRLELEPVSLAKVIEAALETVRPAAEARGVQLVTNLEENIPALPGDPARLQQIIWNLLTNAIKFTPAGGRVGISLRRTTGGAEIAIADSGQGIAPDFLPHVFERFRQADASSTRRYRGLGIGLSIVKQLVEMHGGHVAAVSAGEGTGATFTITLPIGMSYVPREPSRLPAETGPSDGRRSLSGLSVLVVEDEEDTRVVLTRLLGEAGATVRMADSASAALDKLRLGPVDVLVSDIGMPNEDGYSLIRKIRAQTALAALPAIALTAFARREDRERALQAGFQLHMTKPIEATDLVDAIRRLAGK